MRPLPMVSTLIFPLQLQYLSTFILTIFALFLVFLTSNGIDFCYKNCSSLISCGNIQNIGYPFWMEDQRAKYCGHPALELQCPNDENLVLTLHGHHEESSSSYEVMDISKSTMEIRLPESLPGPLESLAGPPHHQGLIPCHNPPTLNIDLLNYSSTVQIITLFYDCDLRGIAVGANDSITCREGQTAYYLRNSSRPKFCKRHIKVPVLRKELHNLDQGTETLEDVLKEGIQVDFSESYMEACLHCEQSGGKCGSTDYYHFYCFCKDAAYPHYCPKSGFSKLKFILIGSVSLALGTGGLIVLILILRKRSTRKLPISCKERTAKYQNAEAFLKMYGSLTPKRYTYSSIKRMTNSFKEKLGEGGYATVYKGKLSDGLHVAVKLFKQLKGNGEDFINEVASIGRTNHVNIVSLLGFCFEGKKRALIYEFMSNGPLEKFTFHNGSNQSLTFEMLFNIAQGIARGLDYLHQGCNERILHFDIKPHNILLDDKFFPKISDFGLAQLYPQERSSISMLEARGTIGYIAPEVFSRNFGSVSHKSDVYSYGMMVLDLVCGRTNTSVNVQCSSELYFPHWIHKRLELEEEVTADEIMDDEEKRLQRKMILVGLWCIQTHPSSRPSMSRVLELLNGCLESIPKPPKPYLSSPPRLVSIQSSETVPSQSVGS